MRWLWSQLDETTYIGCWVPAFAGTMRRGAPGGDDDTQLAASSRSSVDILFAQAEALQERRRLRCGLLLCLGILYGPNRYPRIMLPPDLFPEVFRGPDLCSRILHASELPVPLHGPDLRFGIFLCGLRLGIVYRLRLGILHGPRLGILYGR